MDDPIKIIHKYKNNNGRVQYHINIFIGDIVDDNCMRILNKIKNLDLYSSLTSLDSREIDILEKNYGNYWYEKFFNSYHINNTKELTLKNSTRMKELKSMYNNEWINTHFTNYKKRMETTIYNYEYLIKEERERKTLNRNIRRQQEDLEDIIDYTTSNRQSRELPIDNFPDTISRINYNINGNQNKPFSIINEEEDNAAWCREDPSDDDSDDGSNDNSENYSDEYSSDDLDINKSDNEYNDNIEMFGGVDFDTDSDAEVIDIEPDELDYYNQINQIPMIGGQDDDTADIEFGDVAQDEFNFEDIEDDQNVKLFESEVEEDLQGIDLLFNDLDETDVNVKLTTREIKNAISNEQYDMINKKILEFDKNKDNNMFDENLKDVIDKNYITHQYIYKDDSIRIIKDKICCGFKNNNKYGESTYIIPSHQYLWSEYLYNGNLEKIMIGQKWIIKNDILKLDVEPNTNLRIYEELRGNLKLLRDNIRRQGKIKREDDDNNILYDYQGYFTYNEIFMVDIYNELGLNYDPNFEEQKNLIDVYLKIYFPKIRPEDLGNILDFLNEKETDVNHNPEYNRLKMVYETIKNNLILENEPMRDIELAKKKNKKDYSKIFKENYVTQSVIRAYLLERNKKVDLFRIFDNFILDEKYPFIQYQPTDGTPRSRYNERYLIENERKEIIMKWFENTPHGISFKVRVDDESDYKYMAINLTENGRIDYKIQWKEEDMSTVEDIKKTYIYIINLIKKINQENERYNINLLVPTDEHFKFAFINTIQRFELPNNFTINHNDLSEFSRYFFPYIALVIEPRKRQSKIKRGDADEKSKFGTYLRYKRVSKYENKTKIEHRIIFFIRNYEFNDQSLSNEIAKEFNITEEQALEEIISVREKYPNIKKSRRILKKLENIPKYKPPGIGVDIQGKTRENYKMRIAGARDKDQLDRIIIFMNVLIYLYSETYLYKRPDRQKMKDKLKRLTKIARRRNKVDEIVNHETNVKSVKQMTSIDKQRLSHKSEDDQNLWSRDCQNSGEDKKRRPQQFLSIEELQKIGYVWNESLGEFKFGHYEKKIMVDADGKTDSNKKKHEAILRAIKLPLDDSGENFIYYTCGPEENGKHMYIGFLKSKNPYGDAKPCCFIKDHFFSKNKEKRNFFLRSIGIMQEEDDVNKISGDQLYILQDTNKIQEGRFAFLPKYLDIFMNYMLNKERVIKNHYLVSTETGYYFKYGARQDELRYFNALCSILDTTIDELRNMLVNALERDKNQSLFTSLNNGDIRTQFETIGNYIKYIKTNEYLEYPLLNDLICSPGVVKTNGMNIIIFQKKTQVIIKSFEKEKIKESYFIVCQNQENIDNITDPLRETCIIIKENKNYYPIIMVTKETEQSKEVSITKTFNYDNKNNSNIINHISKYYKLNCQPEYHVLIKNDVSGSLNAKQTSKILLSTGNKDYIPKLQIIDARYKCKYLITRAGYIIPVIPSGTIYNLNISTNVDSYLLDYNSTRKYLNNIDSATQKQLKLNPIGLFYTEKKQKSYLVSAIMTQGYQSVPIIERLMTREYINKENLLIQNKPNDEAIDKEIIKGKNNIVIDDRVYYVSKNKYETETYQLFRYHLSYYLNNIAAGINYKKLIEQITSDTSISKNNKRIKIKKLLYEMTNTELYKTFNALLQNINNQNGGQEDINTKTNIDNLEIIENVNPYAQAKNPVSIINNPDKTIQIIPEDYSVGDRIVSSDFVSTSELPDVVEFDYSEQIQPLNAPFNFAQNKPSNMDYIKFPNEEKIWMTVIPDSKEIDYPTFILKNNRELCYINDNKKDCNVNKYCQWNSSKNICYLALKKRELVDFINQVTEEFVQNELKASEILRRGEYFVSDIVDYNVFTERPGERIIMTSNVNLDRILSEIFGKENIPKIGKKRYKYDNIQNYEQMNIDNPLRDVNNWLVQNIIDNNNTVFRVFANTYYWLVHPYSESNMRNLGYYSILQTNLSNYYKSQVIDWLLSSENEKDIQKIIPYMKYNRVTDFITKISMDVTMMTNCIVELYVLSKIYETIIYIHDVSYNIIYAIHPKNGVIYDYKKNKQSFDSSKYQNYKKILDIRFHYISKNIYPDKIDALYLKK
ncbi:putative early transcription factor large subunit [Megavirus vitis]|nr:putative early transcription factor large subunit [Megavirus vitis]